MDMSYVESKPGSNKGLVILLISISLIGIVVIGIATFVLMTSVNGFVRSNSSAQPVAQVKTAVSSPLKLSNQNVQKAVNEVLAWTIAHPGTEDLNTVVTGGSAVVEGIRESGSEAQVDIRYVNVHFGYRMWGTPQNVARTGTAQLAHYNDGRWVLKQLVIDPMMAVVNTNTEIKP